MASKGRILPLLRNYYKFSKFAKNFKKIKLRPLAFKFIKYPRPLESF